MILRSGHLFARINDENTQLVSLRLDEREFMHGGGRSSQERTAQDILGWAQSEIIMFPIVGPAKDNKLATPRGVVPLPQHGIVRYLHFTPTEHNETSASYILRYTANTPVPNDKVPAAFWPYSFTIQKTYELAGNALRMTIRITNDDTEAMPYNSGWHPAFHRKHGGHVEVETKHDLAYIEQQKQGIVVDGRTAKTDVTNGRLSVASEAGHFMLWSPKDTPVLCIEPILSPGRFEGAETLPMTLAPGETKTYTTTITPE